MKTQKSALLSLLLDSDGLDLILLGFDFGVLGLAGVELVGLLGLTTHNLNRPSHVAVELELVPASVLMFVLVSAHRFKLHGAHAADGAHELPAVIQQDDTCQLQQRSQTQLLGLPNSGFTIMHPRRRGEL